MRAKIVIGLTFFMTMCVSTLFADDALILNKVVRQRWPWSGKVDIDYVYAGATATNMSFTATWRGQSVPTNIVSLKSAGAFCVEPGQNRFEWDPADFGLSSQTLFDFDVQIAPVAADPRTYLVVDLANGGYSFLSDVPAGGWTDEYKTSKMVFKRIPAGTYRLGYPEEDFYRMEAESGWNRQIVRGMSPRNVTLTSDFYFSIFLTTSSQITYIRGDSVKGSSTVPQREHNGYSLFRGSLQDDGETQVDWPNSGYTVASSSYVGLLREKVGGGLLIDLPTQEQWEIAMRAGTDTLWPSGGRSTNTVDELKAFLKDIAWSKHIEDVLPYSKSVGLKNPNKWGVYDFNVMYEATLSYANDAADITYPDKVRLDLSYPVGGVDPIGPNSSIHSARVFMGGDSAGASWALRNFPTPMRTGLNVSDGGKIYAGLRFAVHLKPLVEVE